MNDAGVRFWTDVFVTSSHKIYAHLDVLFVVFLFKRRRDSSNFGMFSVKDSERVTDDHPTRPNHMTLEEWRKRKDQMDYLNDRTWPYHGMSLYAMKKRTSVLNKFWKDHISDKYGLRVTCHQKRGGILPRCQKPPFLSR